MALGVKNSDALDFQGFHRISPLNQEIMLMRILSSRNYVDWRVEITPADALLIIISHLSTKFHTRGAGIALTLLQNHASPMLYVQLNGCEPNRGLTSENQGLSHVLLNLLLPSSPRILGEKNRMSP